jgi:ABC-type polysaccharide/polyol phosphate export permease
MALFARALAGKNKLQDAWDLLDSQTEAGDDNSEFDQFKNTLQKRLRSSDVTADGGDSADQQVLRTYREELSRLIQAGELESALALIDKVLAAGPAKLSLLMLAANSAFELQDTLRAIAYLERAVAEFPAYPLPKLQLAELLDGQGRFADALLLCEAAVKIAPQSKRAASLRRSLIEKLSESPLPAGSKITLLPLPVARSGNKDFENSRLGSVLFFFRIIWNLALRQIRLRHPRTAFGPLLLLIEPVVYVLSLWLALSFLFQRGRPPMGENWVFFYATGIIPYLMFSHLAGSGARGRMPFKALLEVPLIKPISLLLASALAEFLIMAAASTLLFSAFYAFGVFASINDVYGILSAFIAVWLLGTGFLMLNFGICSVLPMWQTVWQFLQRGLFFTSCIFFMAQSVPKTLRDILVWNPLLICIEWFRHGFYTLYNPPWIDRSYLFLCIGLFLLLGIAMQAVGARYRER